MCVKRAGIHCLITNMLSPCYRGADSVTVTWVTEPFPSLPLASEVACLWAPLIMLLI